MHSAACWVLLPYHRPCQIGELHWVFMKTYKLLKHSCATFSASTTFSNGFDLSNAIAPETVAATSAHTAVTQLGPAWYGLARTI